VSLAALAALGFTRSAQAQGWPQKPVRIMVPFAAGGNTDIIARIVAQRLSQVFGQQFAVENRAGATGALAAEAVARSAADGYTLFLASLPQIAIVPAMMRTAYDPGKDFAPISKIGTNPFVLVVHPSLPVRSISELVEYARGQPSKLAYAAAGVGSMTHLAMAMLLKRAGLEMTPIMYKGGASPLTDVIAGHVKIYFPNLSAVVPHAASGALRLLGVSSEQRAPQIPDIPTVSESGFPGFKILNWTGLMAPAGTPKEIIDRIAREIVRAVKDPAVAEHLSGEGVDPVGNSPEEFASQIAADIPLWAEAVKIAGVQEK